MQLAFLFSAANSSFTSTGPGWYLDDVAFQNDVLAAIPSTNINEEALWIYTPTVIGSGYTFTLANQPPGMTADASTGTIIWTPSEAQGPATYTNITLLVTQTGSALAPIASQSFSVTVNEVNKAPVITQVPNQTVDELTLLALTVSGVDPDIPANSFTFSLDTPPPGASITLGGQFTWTPTEAQGPGTYTITVRATDTGTPPLSSTMSFTVTVREVNLAPTLTLPAIPSPVDEGVPLTFTATATDQDLPVNTPASTLTYSLIGQPSGAVINPSSGVFTWTPSEAQGPGTFTFTVRVTDNGSPALSDSRTVTVTVLEVNAAPMLTLPTNFFTLDELTTLTFTNLAADADLPANLLTFSLQNAPTNMTIDAAGAVRWTPLEHQGPSTNVITVRVEDNGSPALSASSNFTVVVREVNQAPAFANLPSVVNVTNTGSLSLQLAATDTDTPANTLTFSKVSGPVDLTVSPSGVVAWTPGPVSAVSNYPVTVRVTDNGAPNLSADASFTVAVYPAVPSTNCVLAPPGLVAWWSADNTAGDRIGSHHGVLTNGAGFAAGYVSQAFALDGVSKYVAVPDSADWAFGTNEFAIELWANFATVAGTQAMLGSDEGPGSTKKWIFWRTGGSLGFHIADGSGGGATLGSAGFNPVAGQWYHVGVTRSGSSFTFYVNGAALSTDSSSFTVPDANAPLTIGQAENQFFFGGMLDDVRIYNRALAAGEVLAIFNAGTNGMCLPPMNQDTNSFTATVPATANIFGAGHTVAPAPAGNGAGMLPPVFNLPAGTNRVARFTSVTGSVSYGNGNFNGPDGGDFFGPTDLTPFGGISGIKADSTAFLAGVFLDGSEPADPAPALLDFRSTNGLNTNFASLAPGLRQVFYIGNGLTTNGVAQNFVVPAGATRLALGFADGFNRNVSGGPGFYGDNAGSLSVGFTVGSGSVGAAGILQFDQGSLSVSFSEGSGLVDFAVTRTGGGVGSVSINYTTGDGTATAGSDYTSVNGTLVWADGDVSFKTISVPYHAVLAATEFFTVILSSPTGGAIFGSNTVATATIVNNNFPTVSITSPGNNSSYAAPATVPVTASASDSDGSVAKVEFFLDNVILGIVTNAPYNFSFSGVAAGSHIIGARAIDNVGGASDLPTITIVVTNTPPSFTQQPQSLVTNLGARVIFSAAASGYPAPSYQWRKDLANLPGATNSTLTLNNVQLADAGNYSVVASNTAGSVPSVSAMLQVQQPPQITGQPVARSVTQGGTVSFTVSATGVPAPAFQWLKAGANLTDGGRISGATTATLTITNAQVADAANYSVVVFNVAGTNTSVAVPLSVTPVGSFITRVLPQGYLGGTRLTATLQARPPGGTSVHAVEDIPPTGWTVSNISHGGTYDAVNSKVKFGPFFDGTVRDLTYELLPPVGETGVKSFTGIGSADGNNTIIGGASTLDLLPLHPADNNSADFRMTIGEVTAYGAAWKNGTVWPLAPNPIPIDYVTRAGFLWKNGETYTYSAAVTNAPLWWVNTGVVPQARMPQALVAQSTSESQVWRVVPQRFVTNTAFTMALVAGPATGVSVWAVEDSVPTGWTVQNVSDSGVFDTVNRKVKFGPFFDNLQRTLTYDVQPDAQVAVNEQTSLLGQASFDGINVAVRGLARIVAKQPEAQEQMELPTRLPRGEVALTLPVRPGRRYVLEGSADLRIWFPIGPTNTSTSGSMFLIDATSTNQPLRYYRVGER